MGSSYKFPDNAPSRSLRSISRQTRGGIDECQRYDQNLQTLADTYVNSQKALFMFGEALNTHRKILKASLSFIHKCTCACELKTVDEMIKERDKLTTKQ